MNYLLTGQETERLSFRKVLKSDFIDWLPLFNEDESALFLGLDTSLTKEELCEKWFEKAFWRYENNKGGMNVLVDKATDKMVGQCGLLIQDIEGEEYLEVGYAILPEYWGQGYATEAAKKCKEFAFENNYSDEVISCIHVDNAGSRKVAERNGMTIFKSIPDYLGMPVNLFKITKK